MPSHLIILDVSGRKYKTQRITLQVSPYFRNLLDRWADCSDKQEDDSYFIDADPEVFQYILNFMRRPSKFPLFWTKETGFDFVLYDKLEAEADYFLLHDLRDWLQKKRYLDALKTIIELEILSEYGFAGRRNRRDYGASTEIQSFYGSYSGERRYLSPCTIHTQNDVPIRGCYSCEELVKAHGPQYHDAPKKLTLVITRMVFDKTVCVNEEVS